MGRVRRATFLTCVLLSGAVSLVLEVVWARRLTLFLGTTAQAGAAVLGAFMLGLAVGSWVGGHWAERIRRPLRLYAFLETGIALYALLSPALLSRAQVAYAGWTNDGGSEIPALRFLLAFVLLLPPTFLMGGTFPVLVRALEPGKGAARELTRAVGWIYGVNTLGAATGALVAGYFLIPAVGVRATIQAAAATGILVATLALTVLRTTRADPESQDRGADSPIVDVGRKGLRGLLLVGFGFTGMAALLLQVAWIRALVLVLGSSVYAFSGCLAAYLLGIGLGGLAAPWLFTPEPRTTTDDRRGALRVAWLQMGVALAVFAGLPWFERLPERFLTGFRAGLFDSFFLSQTFLFALAASLVLVPTFLLGALFPMMTTLWARNDGSAERGVGFAYATNTLGAVAGAILGGLVVLPAVGLQWSLVAAAGIFLLVAAAFWWWAHQRCSVPRRLAGPALAGGLLILSVVALPRWDQRLLTSGPHFNADSLAGEMASGKELQQLVESRDLLFYAEGADATVAVVETARDRLLVINGKTDASLRGDLATQVLLAQLPLLVHPDPRSCLVIGLGSGITVGSATSHGGLEKIDTVEISPEVVAASRLFNEASRFALADVRVELHLGDARNRLLGTGDRWDVIVSEPSNPWISGVSNLFTLEFFELARARLASGGVMAQWFHTYRLSERDLRSLLATFGAVFPHVTIWLPVAGDLILLGSEEPHELDYERVEIALEKAEIGEDLSRIGVTSVGDLVRNFLAPANQLGRFVGDAPLNTDDRPRIEFSAPRSLYVRTTARNLARLLEALGEESVEAPVVGWVRPAETGLSARALGVEIRAPGVRPEGQKTRWQVRWSSLVPSAGGLPALVFGERRTLEWRESEGNFLVSGSLLDHRPLGTEMRELLKRWRQGELLDQGVLRPDEPTATAWELARTGDGGLAISIAWTCPDGAGRFYRLRAEQSGREKEGDRPEQLAEDLASRFRCLSSVSF